MLYIFRPNIINTLNAELNPIRHLLALVGARHIVHVSSIRVNETAIIHLPVLPTEYREVLKES